MVNPNEQHLRFALARVMQHARTIAEMQHNANGWSLSRALQALTMPLDGLASAVEAYDETCRLLGTTPVDKEEEEK